MRCLSSRPSSVHSSAKYNPLSCECTFTTHQVTIAEDGAEGDCGEPGSCGSITGSYSYDEALVAFRGKTGSAWQQPPKSLNQEDA
jgi:uncharacterized low-complexity protein